MTSQLIAILTEILSSEVKLTSIELEAMSRVHKMGWQGFKRYFKYRSKDRNKHAVCLKKWFIDYTDSNIPFIVQYDSGSSVMPFDAVLTFVSTESLAQLNRLKDAMDLAFKEKEITLANKINCLIDDQEEEHKYLKRILLEWSNAKTVSDSSWTSRKDHILHKKYKKIEKKLYNK